MRFNQGVKACRQSPPLEHRITDCDALSAAEAPKDRAGLQPGP